MNIVFSWGSGANPWGVERDEKFTKPNHWDGMLEVVGVQGELEYNIGNGQLSDVTGSAHVMGRYLSNAIVSDKSK